MLGDGAEGGFGHGVGVIGGEDVAQRDGFGDGARGRQGAQAHEGADGDFRARGDVQVAEDEDGDAGADEIGEGVQTETDVAGQVGDVRGEAFGVGDARVPDGGHGPALDDEEEHLGGVAGGGESDEGVEADGEAGAARAVDDPQHAEADGDFGEADADDVEDLGDDAPFDGEGYLGGTEAPDVLSEPFVDQFGEA